MILALDPGIQLGFAVHDGLTIVAAGSRKLIYDGEADGMLGKRLGNLLDELYAEHHFADVTYERPTGMRGSAPSFLFGAIFGKIEEWCVANYPMGIDYYRPAQIKTFATGNGIALKQAMLEAARKRWPKIEIIDDNMADAMFLAELATKGERKDD